MTDHEELIRRLEDPNERCLLHFDSARAINELVADYKGQGEALIKEVNAKLEAQMRAEKAEEALRLWAGAGESSTETIERLVAERDRLSRIIDSRSIAEADLLRRAERAEADLAATRAALRYMVDHDHPAAWMSYPDQHAPAIAAARAEGGE